MKGLANVLVFEFGKFAEALGPVWIESCNLYSPTDGETRATNARLPVHLPRINGNPIESMHVFNYLGKELSASRSSSGPAVP